MGTPIQTTRRPHIILVSSDYIPNPGGIARHVHGLAGGLSQLGAEVMVVSLRYRTSTPANQAAAFGTIRRFLVPRVTKIRGFCFAIQASLFLTLYSRRRSVDCIHWHTLLPDSLAVIWARSRVKAFTNHSSSFLIDFVRRRRRWLYSLLLSGADVILAPSEELRATGIQFLRREPGDVRFLSNGVDPEEFRPITDEGRREARRRVATRHGIPESGVWILAPRRVEPKCGLTYLVRAVGILSKRGIAEFRVVIAGGAVATFEGEQERLSHSIVESRVEEWVFQVGSIAPLAMPEYYRAADIVVIPSLMEATSIAGLEAMASGLPLVATHVGGLPQIVADGRNGLLVPPEDPAQLAAAIETLVADRELREELGRNGRQRVLLEFTWLAVAKATLAAYGVEQAGEGMNPADRNQRSVKAVGANQG